MLLFTVSALGAAPSVDLSWGKRGGLLRIEGAEGEHLALDAPADVTVSWGVNTLVVSALGEAIAEGVPLHDVRGTEISARFQVSICSDDGTRCQPMDQTFVAAVAAAKKGEVALTAVSPREETQEVHTWATDGSMVAEGAWAEAASDNKRVLLDFGAVWCPPCVLLAAELLDDPPEELDGFVVAKIDVDDKRSWPIKDRYHVGGYPTVVITEADGTEVARMAGYSGREAFLAWASSAGTPASLEGRMASGPAATEPAEAAAIALALVEANRKDEAAQWLERAEDGVPAQLARFSIEPTVDGAAFLAEHAADRPLDWMGGAIDLVEGEPDLRASLRLVLGSAIPSSQGEEAGDLLYLSAQLAEEADAPLLYAAAAAAVRTGLTGDPAHDRAYTNWLAGLTERGGDPEAALALLREAIASFPEDPTYSMQAAAILMRMERYPEAQEQAENALSRAWGDNRLRAAAVLCSALRDGGDPAAADVLAQRVLEEEPVPEDGLDVRTPRYRAKLEVFLLDDG